MTTTKKLLVLLAVALGACQADNRSSIDILGRAAPSSDTDCTFAAGGEFQLGTGVLDVGSTYGQPRRYQLPLYVNNNLVDPTELSSATVTSAKTWHSFAARVRVNPSSYVKDYRPNPALLPVSTENVVPTDGKAIRPSTDDVVWVEVVSSELGMLLQSATPATGERRRVVLGITIQGSTNDGLTLDTGEWYYAIDVCQDCLAPPACVAPGVVVPGSCGGFGQDAPAVCVVPQG